MRRGRGFPGTAGSAPSGKEQDYKNGVLDEGLTDEEYDRLAEIHKKPLTEYQKQALEPEQLCGGSQEGDPGS